MTENFLEFNKNFSELMQASSVKYFPKIAVVKFYILLQMFQKFSEYSCERLKSLLTIYHGNSDDLFL